MMTTQTTATGYSSSRVGGRATLRAAASRRIVRMTAADDNGRTTSNSTTETAEEADAKTETGADNDDNAKKFTNKDAFSALANLGGKSGGGGGGGFGNIAAEKAASATPFAGGAVGVAASNPFAIANNTTTAAAAHTGFVADGVDPTALPPKGDADRLLLRFDRDQRRGELPGVDTPDGSPQCVHPPLRAACRSLASMSTRVMMGICAPDAAGGLTVGPSVSKSFISFQRRRRFRGSLNSLDCFICMPLVFAVAIKRLLANHLHVKP